MTGVNAFAQTILSSLDDCHWLAYVTAVVKKSLGREALGAYLRKSHMTSAELAERLGVTPGAVSRWVNGSRAPDLSMAHRLERELGIKAEEWIS